VDSRADLAHIKEQWDSLWGGRCPADPAERALSSAMWATK